jgi:hypothetical protein
VISELGNIGDCCSEEESLADAIEKIGVKRKDV